MTKDQFIFHMETQKTFEFLYDNCKYIITNDKNSKGEGSILFGLLYDTPQKFASLPDFWNNAKIGIQQLHNILETFF